MSAGIPHRVRVVQPPEPAPDLERDPDLRVTAAWVTLVIAVSILVGWLVGRSIG